MYISRHLPARFGMGDACGTATSLVAQGREVGDHILDLLGSEKRLALEGRSHPGQPVDSVVGRHDRVRIEPARIDDAQAQLTFAPARAGSLQIGRQRPLKFFFRKRSAVAEETEAQLPIADEAARPGRV